MYEKYKYMITLTLCYYKYNSNKDLICIIL